MTTVQDIYDAFLLRKRDLGGVGQSEFIGWVNFALRFVYKKLKGVEPGRFVKTASYSAPIRPWAEALPSDFRDMSQSVCGLFIDKPRKRLLLGFDDGGDTTATYDSTSAYDGDRKVEGATSRGFVGSAGATMTVSLSAALDLTDFADGEEDSPTNDEVSIWLYIANSVPTSATIEFSTNSDGSSVGVDQYSYTETGLSEGWNRISVAKSSFTKTGSPDWSSLSYIRLTHAGGSASTDALWDGLELRECAANGDGATDQRIGLTGRGSASEGYWLDKGEIVFTGHSDSWGSDYLMAYIPRLTALDDMSDYLTVDGTATGEEIVTEEDEEYMVSAIDVLYSQWDRDPSSESEADFRFVRALEGLLESSSRVAQVPTMANPSSFF